MHISKITIQNFRSIGSISITPSQFNVFVGQNNHGKSNFLEAIEWFYNGTGDISEIRRKGSGSEEIFVEIEFSDIQSGINKMQNEKNKTALLKEFSDRESAKIIRKVDKDNKAERLVFYPDRGEGEYAKPVTGFDKTLNDFLPKLQFVKTETHLKDIAKYGSKTEIGQMLSGVVNEVLFSEDEEYREFVNKFNELFVGESSRVSLELAKIGTRVENHLKKQFAECEEVQFQVKSPKFDDLLKNFETNVDDGHKTTASEKGDGMQRALMLAIIQTYADYRRENENIKNFIFLIDEAELHLHPKAQRSLKNALLELANGGDQIIITSHSSVLISDEVENQELFKVEKLEKITNIQPILEDDKHQVVFELLGGSPSDLLLPDNFLIVEGRSEFEFISRILTRFYSEKKKNINILQSQGFLSKSKNRINAIHECFLPLVERSNTRSPIYRQKLIIIHDDKNSQNKSEFNEFHKNYPDFKENNQIFNILTPSLESYYPEEWKNETKMNGEEKVILAKKVGDEITFEQFKSEMDVMYNALEQLFNKSF
jgi:putative ATP-dependent endonuclease of the OLD family